MEQISSNQSQRIQFILVKAYSCGIYRSFLRNKVVFSYCLVLATMCDIHVYFYHPQTQFAMVMFSQVSVCPQGRSAPLHAGIQTPQTGTPPWAGTPPGTSPGQVHPPQGRYSLPWAGTPPRQVYPPAQCMLGYTSLPSARWDTPSPCTVHAGIRSTNGNAFLY